VIGKKYGDTRKVLKQASDYLKPHKRPAAKTGAAAVHSTPGAAIAKEVKSH
jgi:hypothetical protein